MQAHFFAPIKNILFIDFIIFVHNMKQMKKVCQICGKEFVESHKTVRFCSRKCAAEWRKVTYIGSGNPRWKGGFKHKKCNICGVIFDSSDGRAKYCPQHRGMKNERNPHWNGGKVLVTIKCKCCGKDFRTSCSQLRKGRKFCSHSCSNIMKNRYNKKAGTSIERTVEKWLSDNRVNYEKQVPLHGITLADFLVGTTAVQCDGVYWHSLPGRALKDAKQDKKLEDMGYIILRISDKEITDYGPDVIMKKKCLIAMMHNQHVVNWR
jgi:very-short-patch-repair endonuclease